MLPFPHISVLHHKHCFSSSSSLNQRAMSSLSSLAACFLIATSLVLPSSLAARRLTEAEQEQPLTITYHRGPLLSGAISVNLIWYGNFSSSQRSVLIDFVDSVSTAGDAGGKHQFPSVTSWWAMTEKFFSESNARPPQLTLGDQILDEACSLGKSLKNADIAKLASRGSGRRVLNVVFTAEDVAVEGFCLNRCASHSSRQRSKGGRFAYIWVGNSAVQCPGQCAWPFHQPIYGPQAPPLVAPNGDVGIDGMVINLASMAAGAVTNPFGNGFFMGPKEAPLEAATACPGVYGKGAYPGYAGELLIDATSGASYNAYGAHSRKFLLPAIFDPSTASCSTLV
ncbi:hypothetical protein HPP92_015749 [Vanilla planifolia]|uniref:Uncharacterized protein n=1 Tax=Vanilla planifolia TaxID=51239 RepID=A0A835URF7_VANPL|nr:hypothetical protein HPP92_015749 [Vanilla planifolia]